MDRERVDAVVGEAVVIDLGGTAANGYEWQVEASPGVRVERSGSGTDSGERAPTPPGDATTTSVTLVPEIEGTYEIRCRLVRPWQADRPARERLIELVAHGP